MVKPVYYSDKMKKYYFNENVFGTFKSITVYGVENITIKPEDVKLDKNNKKYVVMELKKEFNQAAYKPYFKAVRVAEKKVANEENDEQKSAF